MRRRGLTQKRSAEKKGRPPRRKIARQRGRQIASAARILSIIQARLVTRGGAGSLKLRRRTARCRGPSSPGGWASGGPSRHPDLRLVTVGFMNSFVVAGCEMFF